MPIENNKTFITSSPKINFFIGLILGVAIISTLGFLGINFTKNNKVDNNTEQVAGEQKQPEINLEITESDHILGNPDAPIKIFEFSDFQCPYCAMFHEIMYQIVEEYGDQVAWIYKQFPIASHPLGMPGALATECAGEQKKFWEMSDKIFGNQDTLTADSFAEFAEELNLDTEKFDSCVTDEKYAEKIISDYQLGIDAGVGGTPTSFINNSNQSLPGAVPYENMKEIIDELL